MNCVSSQESTLDARAAESTVHLRDPPIRAVVAPARFLTIVTTQSHMDWFAEIGTAAAGRHPFIRA